MVFSDKVWMYVKWTFYGIIVCCVYIVKSSCVLKDLKFVEILWPPPLNYCPMYNTRKCPLFNSYERVMMKKCCQVTSWSKILSELNITFRSILWDLNSAMDEENVNREPTVLLDEIRSFEMISFSHCKIQSLIMQLYEQSFKKPCTVE